MPNKELILSILRELTNDDSLVDKLPLDAYLKQNPDTKDEADVFKNIWADADKYKTAEKFDAQAAFSKFQNRIAEQKEAPKVVSINQTSNTKGKTVPLFSRRRLFSIAAIGLLLIGVSFLFLNQGSQNINFTNNNALASHEILADGTKLTMAPNASVDISSLFGKRNRETTLTRGQVFYDVAKNKELPFSVEVGELKIVVTGTSFNVKWNRTVQIDLVEGSIEVSHKDKDYSLKAGEQLIFNPENQSITLNKELDPNAIKWLENGLSFNSTPITKVISDIESFYGVNIDIKTTVPENCHFTSPDLSNVSLNDLFAILLSAQGMIFDRYNDKNYALVEISCKD